METILDTLRTELAAKADPIWKACAERYFKETVQFYGLNNYAARKIGIEHFSLVKWLGKAKILALCGELMQTGLMEETIIACEWSERQHRLFEPCDFVTFERWI